MVECTTGAGLETQASRKWGAMVRSVVLALLCWFGVSIPATVILGRIMRGSSKTPTVPVSDPDHGTAAHGPPTTAVERDELAAAEYMARDLEPTPL